VASATEYWEPETTLRNLRLIDQARSERGEETAWLKPIVTTLQGKVAELRPDEE
jgi:hypothetical protein